MAEGRVFQWAVRGPGMPQKVMRSDKDLSEKKIKELYLQTVKFLESSVKRGDSDVPWKIIPMTDADILKANLSWCLKETRRRNHHALIEVVGGKITGGKIVDGKFIPDLKPKVESRKEKVRVDVSTVTPAR